MADYLWFLKRRIRKIRLDGIPKALKHAGEIFLEKLENKYIAFVFISIILLGSYYLEQVLWKYIFTALITYFAATLFMRYSLSRGFLQKKKIGKGSASVGHAFVLLIFIIVIATFFSNWLAGVIANFVMLNEQYRLLIVFAQTIIILGLLLLDLIFEL